MISKGLDISGFGIVEYSLRSESRRIIALRADLELGRPISALVFSWSYFSYRELIYLEGYPKILEIPPIVVEILLQ